MEFKYNVTGAERKRLVNALAEQMECRPFYKGAPSFAYEIGACTVDKNGCVTFEDSIDSDEVEQLVEALLEIGFTPEPAFEDLQMTQEEELGLGRQHQDPAGEDGMQPQDTETASNEETPLRADRLSIGLPRDGLTDTGLRNLCLLIASKARLLQRALGSSDLPVAADDHKIYFDWFPAPSSSDELDAYTKLVTALVSMAKAQKRVTAVERETDNDKYAFRCFLLRLGFIGEEYKAARKILLRNLSGNGAFKAARKPVSARESADSTSMEM